MKLLRRLIRRELLVHHSECREMCEEVVRKPLGVVVWCVPFHQLHVCNLSLHMRHSLWLDSPYLYHDSPVPHYARTVDSITPWNFPVIISVSKWAPALFYGNTVIVKPSPQTSLCDLLIAEILAGTGIWNDVSGEQGCSSIDVSRHVKSDGECKGAIFPPGVFAVLTSSDTLPDFNLGDFLCKHPDVNKVSFTGSTVRHS